jgi:hypothetical protein
MRTLQGGNATPSPANLNTHRNHTVSLAVTKMVLVMFLRFGKKSSLPVTASDIASWPLPCWSGPSTPGKQLEYLAVRHVPQRRRRHHLRSRQLRAVRP